MKHKLLSLIALAMCMSVGAWAYDDPVRPTPPAAPLQYTGEWATPVDGGKYYIYNEGAGLFLGGGQTWGTRGIVLCDSVVLVDQDPVSINNVSGNTTANYVLPFELVAGEVEGQWTIKVLNNSKATGGDEYFVGEDGSQTWIDGGTARHTSYGAWTIAEYQGGYMIKNVNASTVKYLGEDGEEVVAFGVDAANSAHTWAATWTDLAINRADDSNIYPQLVWKFVDAANGEAVREYSKKFAEAAQSEAYQATLKAYEDALAAFNLKGKLLTAIEEAEAANISTEAAVAVYNNPNATLAEVTAAYNKLMADINRSKYDFSGATEQDPLDVTDYVLTNPTFDNNIDGWTITVGGQNLQWQQRTDGQVDESKNWVRITNFIEAWTPNTGALTDGRISQTVYGLPAGKYILECDAMATRQGGLNGLSAEDAVEGAYIFIEGDGIVKSPIKSPDTQPKHWSVVYISEGADAMSFGLMVENTTANWISADNFKLTYYGATTKPRSLIILEEAIKAAKEIDTNVPVNAEILTALEAQIDAAETQAASEGTDEDFNAATAALNAAVEAFKTSAKDYETCYAYFNNQNGTINATIDQILENEHWDALLGDIEDLQEEIMEAFSAGTLTSEQITEALAKVPQLIRDFIKGDNVKPGDNLTLIIENADFSEGSGATNIPGWTINSGAITELSATYHNIEAYHRYFDFSQTLKDLPQGTYDIAVQGFVRVDANADNGNYPVKGDESNMVLYGGITKNKFKLISEEYSETALLSSGGDGTSSGSWPYDTPRTDIVDGATVYVPNSMQGAKAYFDEVNPMTEKPFYLNTVRIVHTGGDLTIGVRCDAGNLWILWDNFQLIYQGDGIDNYYPMITDAYEDMMKAAQADDKFITAKANKDIEDITVKYEGMYDNITTSEQALAFVDEINAVTEYIKAGNKKGAELQSTYDTYNFIMSSVSSSDQALPVLMAEIDGIFNDPTEVADNEAIDAKIDAIKRAWTAYVLYDAEEEPATKYDATYAIYNPDYSNYNLTSGYNNTGWTVEATGGTTGVSFNAQECYNNDRFTVAQKIVNLKPGFYELAVSGFYRAGAASANDSLAAVHNAYLYATSSIGEMTAPVKNAMEEAQTEQLGTGSESDITLADQSVVYIPNNMEAADAYFANGIYANSLFVQVGEDGDLTIGVKKWEHLAADWTIFANWQLYYLGKTGSNFGDDLVGVRSLDNPAAQAAPAQVFGLDGRIQSTLVRGVNIVRMSDGSVRKVLVK